MATAPEEYALTVSNLKIAVRSAPNVEVVSDMSFAARRGKVLGIVGESGSGKSMSALAIGGLLPESLYVKGGSIDVDGVDVCGLKEDELRHMRGSVIGYVFQEPMTALNPMMSIGDQISERLRVIDRVGRKAADARTRELLDLVGISDGARTMKAYPHMLSGGMRQRVVIATALAASPRVLIADEPTTALDVSIQQQILSLFRDLQEALHITVLLITHDLAVVAEYCDDIVVCYAGQNVESGLVDAVLDAPRNPYTSALLGASPPDVPTEGASVRGIPGSVPRPGAMPGGCRFQPRCAHATSVCHEPPPLVSVNESGDESRCWHAASLSLAGRGR